MSNGNGAELAAKKSGEIKMKAEEKKAAAAEAPPSESEAEVEQRIVLTFEPQFIRRLIEMLERELPMQKARSFVETLEASPMVPMTLRKKK